VVAGGTAAPGREGERIGYTPRVGETFTVGGVVARSVSVWSRNVIAFGAVSLLAWVPAMGIVFAVLTSFDLPDGSPGDEALMWTTLAVFVCSTLLASGVVAHAALQPLDGGRLRLGLALQVGVRRALPVVVVGVAGAAATAAGAALLVVPGLALAAATWVAIPAAVAERVGILAALRRSFELTRGRRGAVLAAMATTAVLATGLVLAARVLETAALRRISGPFGIDAAAGLATVVLYSTVLTFPAVAPAVAYHALRAEKDGPAQAELARVFD
jgi:hypothetical protein